jgi:predicted kinase
MPKPEIIFVAGPPAAGKSTYVERNKEDHDIVIDTGELAQALGSNVTHGHHEAIQEFAEQLRDAAIALAAKNQTARRVWIIDEAPTINERYAHKAVAVIVLETPAQEATIRAHVAGRHSDYAERIKAWWHAYEPTSTDIHINPYEIKKYFVND